MTDQNQSNGLAESLLNVNDLLYRMPPSLGITARKNHREDFFQQSTYGQNETMVLDCQTGSDFVDGSKSYLRFEVKTDVQSGFGQGSAANIFGRIVVRTRSGREVCRVEVANLLTAYRQKWGHSLDWFSSATGTAQGYGNNITTGGTVYAISMAELIPCFAPIGNVLLPPQMMEGLRIELSTVAVGEATVGAATSYTVLHPRVQWSTVQLGDAFQRKIGEMAASSGLNVLHKEVFHNQVSGSASAQTAFDFDIKKSASKALSAFFVSRDNARVGAVTSDSMKSMAYDWTSHQAHIGSDYYPMAPIRVNDLAPATAAGANKAKTAEAYYYSNLGMGDKIPALTLSEFGSDNVDAVSAGWSCIAYDFTKGQALDGAVVNNSRSIIVSATALATVGGDATRRIDGYLTFLRAAKYFVSTAEIRD
tara:strand:+ start:829 stop:2091 length:1263 start_codon:yes stop_codon:yes gene_type:complete